MPIISTVLASKVAVAALALAALGGGGAVVAAAAGALPTPAHSVMPVPSSSSTPIAEPGGSDADDSAEGTRVGPDVTGHAAFGLCTAYLAGGVAEGSTPSDALIAVAAEAGVDAYCELIVSNQVHGQSGEHVPSGDHGQSGDHGSAGDHGKPGGAGSPELPTQSDGGTSHRPAEHAGR